MAGSNGFALIAFVAAFFCGCAIAVLLVGFRRIGRRMRRLQGAAGTRSDLIAWFLRNGVRPFRPLARRMLRNASIRRWADELSWWLSRRSLTSSPTVVFELILAVSALLFILAWLVFGSPVFALVMVAGACFALSTLVGRERRAEQEAMREAVPDALIAMGACFRSGFSLLQTFRQLAEEIEGPLGRCFEQAASDLATGMTAEETLERLQRNSAVSEMNFVAIALEIQHGAGGSMQTILDGARESVNTDLALRRSLQVQTAQARLSAQVVTCMPFALLAIISFFSKDFLAPFFSSVLGVMIFIAALTMQVAGVLIARSMLTVGERS